MKKFIFSLTLLFFITTVNAQVGVNTEDPKATLHVDATIDDETLPEGIIAPKLTLDQLAAKDALYGTDQTGAFVYIYDISGSHSANTVAITSVGYYYFDGKMWQPFCSGTDGSAGAVYSFTNGITHSNGTVKLGGALAESTLITTASGKNITFDGVGTKTISGGATTISTPLTMSGTTTTINAGNVSIANGAGTFSLNNTGTKTISGTGRLNVTSDLYYAPSGNAFLAGNVLTIDAAGKATWKAAASAAVYNGLKIGTGTNAGKIGLGGALAEATAITGASTLTLSTPLVMNSTGTKTISGGTTTISTSAGNNLIINGAGETQIFNSLYIKDATAIAGTANGKVLTADAWGKASWQTPSSAVVTAGNGLTAASSKVTLGGKLDNDTYIDMNQKRVEFSNAGTNRFILRNVTLEYNNGTAGTDKILVSSDGYGAATWKTAAELGLGGLGKVYNGLTKDAGTNDIRLGGPLTAATSISGAADFVFYTPVKLEGSLALIKAPLQITSGTPGAGKVLTSDASGNATWQTPSTAIDVPALTQANALVGVMGSGTPNLTGDVITQAIPLTNMYKGTSTLYNTSTSTFTAPEDGVYFFKAYLKLNISGGTFDGTSDMVGVGFASGDEASAYIAFNNLTIMRGAKGFSGVGHSARLVYCHMTIPLKKGKQIAVRYAAGSLSNMGTTAIIQGNSSYLLIWKVG